MRLLRGERALSVAAALALSATQWMPALLRPSATGFGDWQMIHHNWEAAHVALARFHRWPLWDPFHCGGVSILGNPESQLYSPLFALSFVLGTVLAVKLFLLLHIAAAMLGAYWLARAEYGLSQSPAALAGVAWGLSGCFAWDGAGGHATFLPFAFAPWLILSFRRSETSLRCAVLTAALLALALLEGGTYPFPYFILLLGFEFVRRMLVAGARLRALRACVLIGVLVALLGAIRLLPIAIALHDTPRTVESADFLTLSDVLLMLTARNHEWHFAGHRYVWPEYGSYVGWLVLIAAVFGAARSVRVGPRDLLCGLLCFGLLMLGSRGAYYPWPLLHELPVFDSLRVPSRFAVLFTLYVALLAGVGLQFALTRAAAQRWSQRAALLLVLIAATDLVIVNYRVANRWDGPPLSRDEPAPAFHMVSVSDRGYDLNYASFPRLNVGTKKCYVGGMNWHVSPALWSGATPQVRVLGGDGSLIEWGLAPGHAFADVDLRSGVRLVFNQNYAPGWTSSEGAVVADGGRLAVDLPRGRRRIEVDYAPAWFMPSAALSLLGVALSLVLCWVAARRTST